MRGATPAASRNCRFKRVIRKSVQRFSEKIMR
jgi:hypothetical protein